MYSSSHWHLAMIGQSASGANLDTWQCGLRMAGGSVDPVTATAATRQALLDDVTADVLAWWTAIRDSFHTSTKLLRVKFNPVDRQGRYLLDGTTLQKDIPGTSQAGTSQAAPLPSQVAVAVTLLTDAQRGLASKGRLFLPGPSTTRIDQDRQVTESSRAAFQQATRDLVVALNNWPGIDNPATPGVVKIMSDVGQGAERNVRAVSVGRRFDVQRRRANKYPENRPAATQV